MPSRWDPSRVIALFYDAAAGLTPWPDAIRTLSEALGAQSAMLFTPTHPADRGLFIAHGLDPAAFVSYAEYYHAKDLWFEAGESARFAGAAIATGDELVPAPLLERSEWYNDFLKRLDAFHLLTSRISTERHPLLPRIHLSLFRPILAPGFADDERRKLAWLHPHIERALVIGARMASAEARASALADVVEHMSAAAVLLKPDGRLDHANRAAQMLLAAEDGLLVGARGLRAKSRADDAELQRVLAAAASAGPAEPTATVCIVRRPSGRRPFQVIAAPVSSKGSFAPIERAGTVVFIVDPEASPEVAVARVARLLGLTAAEARLAAALAQGVSLTDYAAEAGITEGTARWTLKQALAKTGTEKQAALIALVLKTAIVRPGP